MLKKKCGLRKARYSLMFVMGNIGSLCLTSINSTNVAGCTKAGARSQALPLMLTHSSQVPERCLGSKTLNSPCEYRLSFAEGKSGP